VNVKENILKESFASTLPCVQGQNENFRGLAGSNY